MNATRRNDVAEPRVPAGVLRYEPAEALYGLGDAVLRGRNDLTQVLRSLRAESAVEPTRSENITVTWRRSAVSWAFASPVGTVFGASDESYTPKASIFPCINRALIPPRRLAGQCFR